MIGDIMHLAYFCLLLLFVGLQPLWAKGKIEFGTRIQPMMYVKESGSFTDSGAAKFSMDALRFQTCFSRSFNSFMLDAEFEIDPSEATTTEMLKDGWLQLTHNGTLGIKAGVMKRAVIGQHAISSRKQYTVLRSVMAEYCREYFTPRQAGVTLFAKFWNGKIKADVSLFDPAIEDINGFALKDLGDNPMAIVSIAPIETVNLRYAMAAPQFGANMASGRYSSKRAFIHSLSLNVKPWPTVGLFIDVSLAGDSSDIEKLVPYVGSMKQAVHKSLYIEPRFDFDLQKKLSLQLAPTVELLSIYEKGVLDYEKSDSRFALAFASRLYYGKCFSFDLQWRNLYTKGFSSSGKTEIALRLTYQDSFKVQLREKRREVR